MRSGSLKVAVVHDVLLEYGGAERVLDALIEIFPKAHIYTFFLNSTSPNIYQKYGRLGIHTSLISKFQYFAKYQKLFSIFKPLALLYFYFLDLSGYDLVITSSSSYGSKIVRTGKKTLHICYLHTPPRYLYVEKNQFDSIKKFPLNLLLSPFIYLMRLIDKEASKHSNVMFVNSNEVARRVKKYYGREAEVLYPPITVPKNLSKIRKGEYYLCHSRLVKFKGIELAIKTANEYKIPLKIIGDGYMKSKFTKMAGKTVKFLGWVDDSKLKVVYTKARALLYCAIDEDFGLIPIESMSFGIPVVAYKSGGVIESVLDGKTGIVFDNYSSESLYIAIQRLEKSSFKSVKLFNFSKKFDKSKFKEIITETVISKSKKK